jgi:hypothetical protein
MRQLTDEHAEAIRQVTALKAELAAERAARAQLRRMVAELSLELQQAREGQAASQNVTRLNRSAEQVPRNYPQFRATLRS